MSMRPSLDSHAPAGLEHDKYATLFHASPVGYVTLGRTGTIDEANMTFARMTGQPAEKVIARPFLEMLCKEYQERWEAFLQSVFQSDSRMSFDARLLAATQEPVDVIIDGVADAMNEICLLTVTDISQRKRTERVHLIKHKLEAAGLMAGGIAHDFNNLLSVILLNLDMGRTMIESGHELDRLLREADLAVTQAARLTKRLAMLAGHVQPVCQRLVANELFHQSASLMLGDTSVTLRCELAEDLWPAEIDSAQFEQVIRHLVMNACESMPGGGELALQSANQTLAADNMWSLSAGRYIQLSVIDHGHGIEDEALTRIFDPYYSTKLRGSTKGVGIGLTLCHAIMTMHHGGIIIDSKPGAGTRVDLYFPAILEPPVLTDPRPARRRILLMEDDDAVRKSLGMLLQRMGHEVALAASGEEAVNIFTAAQKNAGTYDAVILDLHVHEGMDGLQTILVLRQLDPAVHAIVMSSHAYDPALMHFDQHGFDGYLVKPCTRLELEKALGRVIVS